MPRSDLPRKRDKLSFFARKLPPTLRQSLIGWGQIGTPASTCTKGQVSM